MAKFNTKLHNVYAVTLDCATATPLKGLIYTEIFTVNISSWKIHELILSVTRITEKKVAVFKLVFFYVEWKKFITNKQIFRQFLKKK